MDGERHGFSTAQHQLSVTAPSSKTQRGSVSTSSKGGVGAKGPFQKNKSKEVPSVKNSSKATSPVIGQDLLGELM